MTAPTSDRDELRQAVKRAICAERCAFRGDIPCHSPPLPTVDPDPCDDPGCTALADAAIAAYERHRPRADVVLTREEWDQAAIGIYSAAYRIKWRDPESFDAFETINAAFPWIRVEGE